ncbi:MAG: DegT/DnrJ/EryC1/StrS aminotransferase family protein [Nitrospinota bacterium]|nr:DegT/DnrJ/EryC1/StrS aminotransferase family protein [Nitrospinota bacterium]
MNKPFLAFCKASLSEEEAEVVAKVIESGWLTTGPHVAAFESEFKSYVGSQHAIALNSCTGGLHCSLLAAGVQPGDDVITTPLTFVATGHVIVWTGAKPVFADIDPETFNIDPRKIEQAVTPRTKAIVPVHFAGLPCEMESILAVGRKHGIPVIEDAAHALGSEYAGKKIGSWSDTTVFSFYPTKNMTSGEGGMVTTDNDELADRIRKLAFFGIDKEVWERYGKKQAWHYDIILPGYKYNMSDIHAAIGRVQLQKLDEFNERRFQIAQTFKHRLKGLEEFITLPPERGEAKHNWHLFPILLDKTGKTREALIEHFRENGVGSSVHFIPLHFFTFYQEALGFKKGDFPASEKVFANIVSLPIYPSLSEGDIEKIISVIYGFFSKKP